MNSLAIVALLVAAVAALTAVWAVAHFSRVARPADAGIPVGPAIDTAALKAEMSAELARTVQETVNGSLAQAMSTLSAQARADREESIKMAAESIAKSGGEQLGTKAQVIETTLQKLTEHVGQRLDTLSSAVQKLQEFNSNHYESVGKAVEALSRRTENLNEILSNSQKRGQWGERVVEDMLRAVGFIENVNYTKQDTVATGGRPDYKFMMPPNRVLFMDVKFPLDKYVDHLNADSDTARTQAKADFVKAVRIHIDALAKREYVNNAKEEALDYVLMFLPNESISGFVHEADPKLMDYALDRRVVLCSPLALYAFLGVIRQATDSFHTEQTAESIMQQINKFNGEWQKYVKAVDEVRDVFNKLNDKIDDISTGGTRFKKLNVPVREIEKMRTKQGIPELPAGESADDPTADDE